MKSTDKAVTGEGDAPRELNGTIAREFIQGEDSTTYTRIADRDKGARKRCDAILAKHPELVAYYQGDPRGASLYIVRKSDLNGSDIHSTYTRGVAVCD